MHAIRSSRVSLVGMLLLPAFLWIGCGTDSVTQPDVAAEGSLLAKDSNQGKKRPTHPWYEVASSNITPGAGFNVMEGSRYTLTFEKGTAQPTIKVVILERDPDIVDAQFWPDGVTFDSPVSLTIDYAGTANDPSAPNYHWGAIRVGRYDAGSKRWELLEGIDDREARTYTVPLNGFSRYAMGNGMASNDVDPAKDFDLPAQFD